MLAMGPRQAGEWSSTVPGIRSATRQRATTVASDRDTNDVGRPFIGAWRPKTRVLRQARRTLLDYDQEGQHALQHREPHLAGLQWEAKARPDMVTPSSAWMN